LLLISARRSCSLSSFSLDGELDADEAGRGGAAAPSLLPAGVLVDPGLLGEDVFLPAK